MGKFKPYSYALFEGKIVPIKQAKISIMTNALHYGTGAFGGIKIFKTDRGSAIFRLDDHLKRLKNSVKLLRFYYDFDFNKIKDSIIELARKNKVSSRAYIRPLIYRSDLNISPDTKGEYHIAVYILDMPTYYDNNGLKVKVSPYVRNSNLSIPSNSKASGGYINSAMAIDEARSSGYDSAIMLDKDGNVSEGAVMNLFIVKGGKLITPSLDSDILEGITRKTIIEIAGENGIKVEQRKVKKAELYGADELFFSGTATDITWCKKVDGTVISQKSGPITLKLSDAYVNLPKTHPKYFTEIG